MPKFIGFEKPQPATREQMAEAIMFGKFLHRDEDGVCYAYQGNVFFLPKKTEPGSLTPASPPD